MWTLFSFLLVGYLGVKFLGHLVTQCLTVWGSFRLFSKVATPFYVPMTPSLFPTLRTVTVRIHLMSKRKSKIWGWYPRQSQPQIILLQSKDSHFLTDSHWSSIESHSERYEDSTKNCVVLGSISEVNSSYLFYFQKTCEIYKKGLTISTKLIRKQKLGNIQILP